MERFMFQKKEDENEEITVGKPTPAWMISYADMITQILIFFVLFVSMSTLMKPGEKTSGLMIPIPGGTAATGQSSSGGQSTNNSVAPSILIEPQLLGTYEQILSYAKRKDLAKEVQLYFDERGLVVSLTTQALFEEGEAEILPGAKPRLNEVAKIIKPLWNNIRVEGYTCNTPIHTQRFPSNWELSSARAINVTRYLTERENFPSSRISAAAYGENNPVVPNNSEVNKARNRRVDIIILWRRFQHLN